MVHTLQKGRCTLYWAAPRYRSGPVAIRITQGGGTFAASIGTWHFDRASDAEAIEIDLWKVDYHSVQIKTGAATRVATRFETGDAPGPTQALHVNVFDSSGRALKSFTVAVDRDEGEVLRKQAAQSALPPVSWFFVELTNRCNYRCQWCPQARMSRPFGAMPFERAAELFRMIAAYRRKRPVFSLYAEVRNPVFLHVMGEPLLYPALFRVVEYGRSLGLDFALVTNASKLDRDAASRLLDCAVQTVVLSVNAPGAESYRQTGSSFAYKEITANVRGLLEERFRRGAPLPRIEIQLLNTRGAGIDACRLVESRDEVEQSLAFWSSLVRDLAREHGVLGRCADPDEALRWGSVLERPDNDPGVYFELAENVNLVFKHACNFANELRPESATLAEAAHGVCRFRCPQRMFVILWDGTCTFCTLDFNGEIALGNVFDQGIDAIWSGERMRRVRALMDAGILSEPLCRRCLGRYELPDQQFHTFQEVGNGRRCLD